MATEEQVYARAGNLASELMGKEISNGHLIDSASIDPLAWWLLTEYLVCGSNKGERKDDARV